MEDWEIKNKLGEIIDSNIEEIPYEGLNIDKDSIIQDLQEFIRELINK